MSALAKVASFAARTAGTGVRRVRAAVNPSSAHPAGAGHPASGWLAVTVFAEPSDIDTEKLPAPLAEFGQKIEVHVSKAPGGKGTELAARLRDRRRSGGAVSRASGNDPQAELRSALRRAKQLIEVGEVLAVDPVPHGERTLTPGGAFVEGWTKAAPKAGVR